jgi:hypothetical protein
MITFIGALEKGLSFYIGVGLKKRIHSRDYKILARAIFDYGMSENTMFSSSMDFAREDGFRTNGGARKLLNRAIRFQNKVVDEINRNTDPHTTVADIWYDYTN